MSLVDFHKKITQAQTASLNKAFASDGGEAANANQKIELYNKHNIEDRISYRSDNVFKSTANYCAKYYKPSGNCMKNYFFKRFPFFKWILSYDVKNDLLKDLIAGLTIGIVHIPQGMAYALMAGIPAINGLYVSFFNVILYVLFGTSKHLSTGTYAIVSLMVYSSLLKYNGVLYPSDSSLSGLNKTASSMSGHSAATTVSSVPDASKNFLSNDPVEAKILITTTLALMVGVIQILFAVLHFGVVTKYLSDSIVNGFTTGAAFHVVVSQISTLLGIKLGDTHIPFVLVGDFIEIFKNISKTNLATLIISIVSMIFLYIVKVHINERFKAKLPVPIPVELIVVIVGTVVSYFGKFGERYAVKTIGYLPLGIPTPKIPPLKVIPMLIGDSVAIAIVSFAINISMAKLFAKKHKYDIMPNQELLSYGIGNVVSSFFKGFPSCVGLSRCAILDSVGGKTQVYGLFSSALILIVILFIAPVFKTLPNACLGAIIVIALKAMVLEVTVFPQILKRNKLEAMAWLATYLGVMILDVDVGLYIGVAVSLLLVIFRSQRARTSILGNVPGTNIYESIDDCEQAKEFKSIKIIRYEESIYYANVDNFKYKIIKYSGVNPANVLTRIRQEKEKISKITKKLNQIGYGNDLEDEDTKVKDILANINLKHIIIDCSCVNYIDTQGVNAIFQLYESYKEIGIQLCITYCKINVLRSFRKLSFKDKFDFNLIYPTTDDAVRHILATNTKEPEIVGHARVVDFDDELVDYPAHLYKAENEKDASDTYDNEYDVYIQRF